MCYPRLSSLKPGGVASSDNEPADTIGRQEWRCVVRREATTVVRRSNELPSIHVSLMKPQ